MIRSGNGKKQNITAKSLGSIGSSASSVSSASVADIMAEEDIYDGILIKIFEYVHVDKMSSSGQRINDDEEETIMPGKTQDDIINLTLVSKRFHKIISTHEENGTRKKWNIVTVFEITPPQQQRVSSVERLFNNLREHSLNEEIKNKLQQYRYLFVKDKHMINCDIDSLYDLWTLAANNNIQLTGIISLHISQLFINSTTSNNNSKKEFYFIVALMIILPNLLEINLSNINGRDVGWAFDCRHLDIWNLERIKWNNIQLESNFWLDGYQIRTSDNLKHIIMDHSIFFCFYNRGRQGFADFEEIEEPDDDDDNIFIFHQCCENVERISIRNAKYTEQRSDNTDDERLFITTPITQNALIKFVRNAPPTLQWFRSDLFKENVEMLLKERPTIEFLN